MSATQVQPQSDCTPEVLAAARQGDRQAFAELVLPHTQRLRRLAHRLTRNAEDAEDICQESLLKAFRKLEQFVATEEVTGDEFRAWLMRITANSAIDFIRRKQACRLVPFEEEAQAYSYRENPETSYARDERLSMLAGAIANLPAELRNVLVLRNLRELSTKEVAARMGISTLAVRLRLFRAHGQLRKSLGLASRDSGQDPFAARAGKARFRPGRRRNDVRVLLRFRQRQAECAYGY